MAINVKQLKTLLIQFINRLYPSGFGARSALKHNFCGLYITFIQVNILETNLVRDEDG